MSPWVSPRTFAVAPTDCLSLTSLTASSLNFSVYLARLRFSVSQ